MPDTTIPNDPLFPDEDVPKDATSTTVKQRRTRGPNKAKTPNEVKNADPDSVTRAIHSLFKIAARITGSTTKFEEREFSPLSKSLIDLSQRYSPLGFLLVALSPFVVIAEILDKVFKLREGMTFKPKASKDVVVPWPDQKEGAL